MPKKLGEYNLTPKEKAFCDLYLSPDYMGNGVLAYAEAYEIDTEDVKQYNVAKTRAYKMLTKVDILSYMQTKLDSTGYNDAFIDKELLFVMTQRADFGSKVAAIKEYNKLKGRVEDKLKLEITNVSLDLGNGTTIQKTNAGELPDKDTGQSGEVHDNGSGNQDG